MKKLLILITLFSLSSFTYASTLNSMNASQAKAAVSDKTIKTVSATTLNGNLTENSFTGYFSPDGKMKGSFANAPDNAPQSDTGVWNVKPNGNFCFMWDHWDNHKERCVTFYKLNNAVVVIAEDNKFETLFLNSNVQSGDQTGSMMSNTSNSTTPAPADTTTPSTY